MGNWKIKTTSLLVSKALRQILHHLPGFPRCHENPYNTFKHIPRQSSPDDFCSVISHVGSVGTREAGQGELVPMWLKHQLIKIIIMDSIQYWQACEKTAFSCNLCWSEKWYNSQKAIWQNSECVHTLWLRNSPFRNWFCKDTYPCVSRHFHRSIFIVAKTMSLKRTQKSCGAFI